MIRFIDEHRGDYGVEPICKVLQIAPSTWYGHQAKRRDPSLRSDRDLLDEALKPEIQRAFDKNHQLYGVRKVWRALRREGFDVARCTVARLMRDMGLRGAIRGKKVRTTIPNPANDCPLDLVNREFAAVAPNRLWVADFTYVSTWSGFVCVAFIIDVYARRIVGWKTSRTANADFVLDALEQALHARRLGGQNNLIHHSDRGSQYLSINYTERLDKAGINPSVGSVGSVGDSYDNALAETVIGLFKTQVINRQGSWKSLNQVELATLDWVHWYNRERLLGPIGYIPPSEAEETYYAQLDTEKMAA